MVTSIQVSDRLVSELFSHRLMDNALRGYWCEMMVAEALGPDCRLVGQGWHAWDLETGCAEARFPERIRIQVKNSARLQPWNAVAGKVSDCSFNLPFRPRPSYFTRDNPGVPCEETGFMCELFMLCHHRVSDPQSADHRNPQQWQVFLVPVVGPYCGVTESELEWARAKVKETKRPSNCVRRPETMLRGIRGRPAIMPLDIAELNIDAVRPAVGL